MRPHQYASADRCRHCGAPVVTASLDVLGDVAADVTVDPTPLDRATRLACVIVGRPLWRYGVEASRGWLGDARVTDRSMATPDDVLPAHVCGGCFPLPYAGWWARFDGVYQAYTDGPVPF